jgi:hypothetical protein
MESGIGWFWVMVEWVFLAIVAAAFSLVWW